MIDGPIVDAVRNARDEYARRFNYDLNAICDDLRMREAQSGRIVVSFPPKRSKPGNSGDETQKPTD
jgi:hypothetical protein